MTTFLIDAVNCLILKNEHDDPAQRTLNTTLADALMESKKKIIVLTNARWPNYKRIRELLSDYDVETYTLENNPPKTDPEYWDRVMMYYGLQPEECFLIDHDEDVVQTASELEIPWELYIDNKQILTVLQSL